MAGTYWLKGEPDFAEEKEKGTGMKDGWRKTGLVTEGYWSRLLQGFRLREGRENIWKHEKGERVQEGLVSLSPLWDLRVSENPEAFTLGPPVLMPSTTRGRERYSSRKTGTSSIGSLESPGVF